MFLTGCNSHFISDEAFRQTVAEDLSARSEVLAAAGVDLEAMDITQHEKEALEFLYAYMSLGDIVNMEPTYYLDHYRLMRKALKEMPWGKSVPEREIRHFVFPVRVNNENLDSARYVFYEELAPRIKNMSMKDAVLEVNHWCHEKAVYMPSDRRTSSPPYKLTACDSQDCLRPLRRGVDAPCCRPPFGRYPCTPGIYSKMGAYRQQPRLG